MLCKSENYIHQINVYINMRAGNLCQLILLQYDLFHMIFLMLISKLFQFVLIKLLIDNSYLKNSVHTCKFVVQVVFNNKMT
jgi:hypothetical protein